MGSLPLEAAISAHETDVQQAKDALERVIEGLRGATHPENLNARNLGGPYTACKDFAAKLKSVDDRLKEAMRIALEHQYNVYWKGKLHKKYDYADPEAKRAVMREINDDLRYFNFVIKHPDTGKPCTLLATTSPDGKGRYVLSDRETRKRTHTSVTLLDLLPLQLMPEPRRREAFIEARKKKAQKKDG